MNKKKKTKLPVIQYNMGGFTPTNNSETQYYPFGGFINKGVTGIASALGANDKLAQTIGSGVATATGFIPGMQDNLFQAGDLIGDTANMSNNKKVQNAGKTVSALSPLLSMIPMANGGDIPGGDITRDRVNTNLIEEAQVENNLNHPDLVKYRWQQSVLNAANNPNLTDLGKKVEADAASREAGYNFKTAGHINTVVDAERKALIDQGSRNAAYIAPTVVKAMGGQLTEFEGNTHEDGGIPLGDSNVEVEAGETKIKDYIFSDRIKLPWNKKATFAEESKKINNKYKDRAEDALAKKSKELELTKLRDMQETAKQDMIAKAQKLMSNAGVQQHQMPNGSMMEGASHPQAFAYGGKIYYEHGGVHTGDMFANYSNTINQANQAANQANPFNVSYTGVSSMGNSLNYSPEEQMVLQGLQTDLANGKITPEQYEGAFAELGQGYNGQNYLQETYPQYLQGQSGNSSNKSPENTGNQFGKQTADSTAANGQPNFNDQLTTGEKLVPYLPVLGQAATLLKGVEKTQYSQATPEFIDLEGQRDSAKKQAAVARLVTNQNIRNTAGNSGRGLTNTVVGNAAIQSNLGDQLGQSYLNEATTNTGIANQFNMANTQIQNQQVDANAANKAKFQEQSIATLANLANTYTGIHRDQRAFTYQNQYNNVAAQNSGTENYAVGYTPDGTPIMKFKPSNS